MIWHQSRPYLTHLLYPRPHNPHLQQLHGHPRLAVSPASKSTGKQAFGVTGPAIWNELSLALRDALSLLLFKCHLKTYLFKRIYGGN